jgi:hypothetical protein
MPAPTKSTTYRRITPLSLLHLNPIEGNSLHFNRNFTCVVEQSCLPMRFPFAVESPAAETHATTVQQTKRAGAAARSGLRGGGTGSLIQATPQARK